eukprot:362507-Chlamydomonas_euryale.AAC.4
MAGRERGLLHTLNNCLADGNEASQHVCGDGSARVDTQSRRPDPPNRLPHSPTVPHKCVQRLRVLIPRTVTLCIPPSLFRACAQHRDDATLEQPVASGRHVHLHRPALRHPVRARARGHLPDCAAVGQRVGARAAVGAAGRAHRRGAQDHRACLLRAEACQAQDGVIEPDGGAWGGGRG